MYPWMCKEKLKIRKRTGLKDLKMMNLMKTIAGWRTMKIKRISHLSMVPVSQSKKVSKYSTIMVEDPINFCLLITAFAFKTIFVIPTNSG